MSRIIITVKAWAAFLFILHLSLLAFGAEDVPQSFNLDGRLFDVSNPTDPLSDSGNLIVQVLNPSQTCILYEQEVPFDTTNTNGYFNVLVGTRTGSGLRGPSDRNNSMSTVFSNTSASDIDGRLAADGVTGCTYNASAGDVRRIRIKVVGQDHVVRVLAPDMVLDSVPNAIVAESAETLQGVPANQFLRQGTGNLTQSAVQNIFSTTNYPILTDLLSGSSSNYVQTDGNGAALPSFSANPAAPVEGQIWYDSTLHAIRFKDHTATIKTIGVGNGSVTSVTAGAGLTGGTITSTGTIALDTVGTAGAHTKVTTDAYGRVVSSTTLAEGDIPTLSTPGKVSGSAINTGTIGGNTSISTTGTIATSSSVSARVLDVYDSDNTNYVRFQTPATGALTTSYDLTLPVDAGLSGQMLTSGGAGGTMTWSSPPHCTSTQKLEMSAGPLFTWSCVSDADSGGDMTAVNTNAGSGLSGGAATGAATLQVEVDGTTVEINGSNDLQVKDAGISAAKLATGSVTTAKIDAAAVTDAKIADVAVGKITSAAATDYFTYTPAGAECADGQVIKWTAANRWECANDLNTDAVSTVFGRTGAVSATAGDYTASQITNVAAGNLVAVNVQTAINELDTEKVAKSGDAMTGNLTMNAQGEVRFADGDSSNHAAIRAPSALGADYILTLPVDNGAPGEILTTDGNGVLSWSSVAGGDIMGVTTAAGSALSGGVTSGTATLTVVKDDVTIETNGSNQLQVKDSGISTAKIANSAVTNAKIADVDVAKVTSALGTSYFTYAPAGVECADGQVLKWTAANRWECANDIDTVNAGDVTEVTTAAGSGLVGGATSGAIALALDFGTTADQIQKNSSIPHCTSGQKLEMSAGPTYVWSCVSEAAVTSVAVVQDADADTKIQVEEAADEDRIRFDTGGTERMIIDAAGNVGIGTTTPLSTEGRSLHINNSLSDGTVASNASLIIQSETRNAFANIVAPATGKSGINFRNTTASTQTNQANIAYDHSLKSLTTTLTGNDTASMDFFSTLVDPATVDFSTTTVPSTINIRQGTTSTLDTDLSSTSIMLQKMRAGTDAMASIGVRNADTSSTSPTLMQFWVRNGAGLINPMTLNSAGNVGIGTAIPGSLLHVNGVIRATDICDENGANCKDISSGWGGGGDIDGVTTHATTSGISGGTASGTATLAVVRDETTIEVDGANQLRVKDLGISTAKLAAGAVTNAKVTDVDVAKITSALGTSYFTYTPAGAECVDGQVLKWTAANRWECANDTDTNSGGDITAVTTAVGSGLVGGSTTGAVALVLDFGTAADQIQKNSSIPHCTSAQKLEMSAGPTYVWSCVSDPQVTAVATVQDADSDTKIQVEELADEDKIRFDTAGTERMIIDETGLVGIGTASPGAALEVSGSATGQLQIMNLTNTVAAAAGRGPRMSFQGNGQTNMAYVGSAWEGAATTDAALTFSTRATSSVTEKMRVTSGGNVGVGTSAPNELLHLNVAGANRTVTQFTNGSTGTTATDGSIIGLTAAGDTQLWNYEATNMRFGTSNSERMRIDATGNVGVGNSNPQAKLDVAGTIRANEICDESGSNCKDISSGWGAGGDIDGITTHATTSGISGGTASGTATLAIVRDETTIEVDGTNQLRVKDLGITSAKLAAGAVTNAKVTDVDVAKITSALGTSYFTYTPAGAECVDGQVLKWTAANRWECANDIDTTNTGDITQVTTAAGSGLLGGQTSGAVALVLDFGTAADQIQKNSSIPHCTSSQKLEMSAGPTYVWSCVSDPQVTAIATVQDADSDTKIQVEEAADEDKIRFDTAGTERMIIDQTGKVGIGTASPAAPLEVVTTSSTLPRGVVSSQYTADNVGAAFAARKARGTAGSPAAVVSGDYIAALLAFGHDGSAYQLGGFTGYVANGTITGGSVPMDFIVNTGDTNGGSEKLRITSTGNVGIGTTNPQALLHVNGVLRATDICDENGANCKDISSGWGAGGDIDGITTHATTSGISGGTASGTATLAVVRDETTIEVNGSNQLRVKDLGITSAKLAAGAVTNAKVTDVDVAKITSALGTSYFTYTPAGAECTDGQVLKWTAANRWECANDTDTNTDAVATVFGRTGAVVATNGDYTASQVTSVAAGNLVAVTVQAAVNELDTEKVAKAGDAMTGSLTMNAQNEVRYGDADSAQWAAIRAPATIGTSYTLTLPTTDGNNGEVLTTDGSGILTWAPAGGAGDITQVTTAAGSGLVGGQTSGAVALALDFGTGADQVQKNSSIPNCATGQKLIMNPGPTYSWACVGNIAMSDADGDTRIQVEESADEDKIRFDTAGSERMVIDNTGFVGIGTASPSRHLEVTGADQNTEIRIVNTTSSTSRGPRMTIRNYTNGNGGYPYMTMMSSRGTSTLTAAIQNNDILGSFEYVGVYDTAGGYNTAADVRGEAEGAFTSGSSPGRLVFRTTNSAASSPSEKMRITSGGNVGIGTNNPTQMLSVAGTIQSTTGGIMFPDGTVQSTSATGYGTNNTVIANWPDVIRCVSGTQTYIQMLNRYSTVSGQTCYREGTDTATTCFTTAGAYSSGNGSTDCQSNAWTITQLYAMGRAYNFAKGPAAQWMQNGTDGYYNAGNVGIGTSAPNQLLTVEGVMSLRETAAPSLTANYGKLYVKSSDSKLYFMNDAGVEKDLSAASGAGDFMANGSVPMTSHITLAAGEQIQNTGSSIILSGTNSMTVDLADGSGNPTLYASGNVVRYNASVDILNGRGLNVSDTGNDRTAYFYVNNDAQTTVSTTAGDLSLMPFTGRVGVGRTAPGSALDVNGIIRATDLCDETGANCKDLSAWTAAGDITGVTTAAGSGLTGGGTSGSVALVLDFGTGADQVKKNSDVPNCTSAQKLQMSAGPTYTWTCVTDQLGSGGAPGGATGNIQYYNGTAFAGTNNLFWDNTNSRIGIGTNSPANKLHISGTNETARARIVNNSSSTAQYPGYEVVNYAGATSGSPVVSFSNLRGNSTTSAALASGDLLGSYEFWGGANTAHAVVQGATILAKAEGTFSASSAPTGVVFATTPAGEVWPYERVRIASNGNVGIGANTPSNKLHISGAGGTGVYVYDEGTASDNGDSYVSVAAYKGANAGSPYAGFYSYGTNGVSGALTPLSTNSEFGGLYFRANTVTSASGTFREAASVTASTGANWTDADREGHLQFWTSDGTSTSEKMRINHQGYVGIGTTSPSQALSVSGNVSVTGRVISGAATDADALSAITLDFTNTNTVRVTGAAAACGTLNFTNVVAGGQYTVTIPNATASCTTIHMAGATTNVKLPSGYTGGVGVSGVVYTAIHDGTTLWVSYVPF